jgi:hypothetical protein
MLVARVMGASNPLEGLIMKRLLQHRHFSASMGVGAIMALLTVLLLVRSVAEGQAPKPPAQPAVKLDRPKADIEGPTKRILAKQTQPAVAPAGDTFVNPKVQPGKVRWHKDFDTACAVAQRSGKPVLLFQMMGKLDERFC